jgi:hypothetical protein
MRRIALLVFAIGFLLPLLASAPAHAQASRTWVSGVGDDANPCSRTAPCKTFAGAISKTAAGGEINCLDSAGFGAVTITKSMSIYCEGVIGGVLASGTTGVIINAAATDFVLLKGLDIDGGPPTVPGINGIRILSAGFVHVEDCVIHNFKSAAPNGFGIKVDSTTSPTFVVSRTTFFNNGTGATGGAIQVGPTAGSATGTIDRVIANRNVFGLAADGSGGSAGINLTVKDSTFNGNTQSGIVATTPSAGAGVMVMRSSFSNNAIGLQVVGASANIRVGDSLITGNGTGVSGTVLSYGTNQLDGNAANGTLTALPAPALH